MKITTLILNAVCTLAAMAADNHPNLTGEWRLNAGRSVFGPIPPPVSLTRRIVHSDPSLTVTEEQKGGSGDHVSTRHYTTDGKQVAFEENGTTVLATARWEGNALVIKSTADMGGATIVFIEKLTLSDVDKTLTDVLQIATPQGAMEATFSFEKQ